MPHPSRRLRIAVVGLLSFIMALATAFGRTDRFSGPQCEAILKALVSDPASPLYRSLDPTQIDFLRRVFLPVVGQRGFVTVDGGRRFRECHAFDHCIILDSIEGSARLVIRWVPSPDLTEPRITVDSTQERILAIPQGFDWLSLSAEDRSGVIKSFLMGHPLHPQIPSPTAVAERRALNEPEFILRPVQRDAIRAVTTAIQSGRQGFLYVAPTGTGKTEVIFAALIEFLRRSNRPLHFVIADTNFITEQIDQLLRARQSSSRQAYTVVKWGDGAVADLEDVIRQIQSGSGGRRIIVTTIQSLKAALDRFLRGRPERFQEFTRSIGFLGYDEAHHIGAPQALDLFQRIADNRDPNHFFYGTSATPFHARNQLLELWRPNTYLAYIDSPVSYTRRPPMTDSETLSAVLRQLFLAQQSGDLAPIHRVFFLQDEANTTASEPLFLSGSESDAEGTGNRYVLNPRRLRSLASSLTPLFSRHESGFISVGTINEAQRLQRALEEAHANIGPQDPRFRRFAVLHSQLPRAVREQVMQDLSNRHINFIITVKQFDEGADYPHLSLYVDLNRTVGVRQFLQRSGRVLRLSVNKPAAELATAMAIDEATVQDMITWLRALQESRRSAPRSRNEGRGSAPREASVFDIDDESYAESLAALEARAQRFWQTRGGFSVQVTAEQINQFVAAHGRLPIAARGGLERNLHARFKMAFRLHRDEFVELLDETSRAMVVSWLIRFFASAGSRIYVDPIPVSIKVNQLFADYSWLMNEVERYSNAETLKARVYRSFYSTSFHITAEVTLRIYGRRFTELIDPQAQDYYQRENFTRAQNPDRDQRIAALVERVTARYRDGGRIPNNLTSLNDAFMNFHVLTEMYNLLPEDVQPAVMRWIVQKASQLRGDPMSAKTTVDQIMLWIQIHNWVNFMVDGPPVLSSTDLPSALRESLRVSQSSDRDEYPQAWDRIVKRYDSATWVPLLR